MLEPTPWGWRRASGRLRAETSAVTAAGDARGEPYLPRGSA